MQIKLAQNYGSCFGVKRAIRIAEEHGNAYTYGPLIHNNQEIERLNKSFNVKLAQNITDFQSADKVIVRTHGIEKNELIQLRSENIDVIDATCPFVTKPQEIVEKMSSEGYEVVIFGDADHPEIKGVKSYAINGAYVVLNVDEVAALKLKEKIAVVAQTTRKIEEFLKITDYLIAHFKEVRVFNTICNATYDNQESAKELAMESDIIIVIGGKHSSNTKQLLSICQEHCDESYLIETEEDLDEKWFEGKQKCGITAGASTPDWIIDKIIKKIDLISKQ